MVLFKGAMRFPWDYGFLLAFSVTFSWRGWVTFVFLFRFTDLPTLRITSAQKEDNGAYLCIASNGIPPQISKRFTLNVLCKYLMEYQTFKDLGLKVSSKNTMNHPTLSNKKWRWYFVCPYLCHLVAILEDFWAEWSIIFPRQAIFNHKCINKTKDRLWAAMFWSAEATHLTATAVLVTI